MTVEKEQASRIPACGREASNGRVYQDRNGDCRNIYRVAGSGAVLIAARSAPPCGIASGTTTCRRTARQAANNPIEKRCSAGCCNAARAAFCLFTGGRAGLQGIRDEFRGSDMPVRFPTTCGSEGVDRPGGSGRSYPTAVRAGDPVDRIGKTVKAPYGECLVGFSPRSGRHPGSMRCPVSAVCRVPYAVCRVPCAVRRPPSAVRRAPCTAMQSRRTRDACTTTCCTAAANAVLHRRTPVVGAETVARTSAVAGVAMGLSTDRPAGRSPNPASRTAAA